MLLGRAFYESLGSPRLILAPMVDQSEFAWRMLSRSFFPPESRSSVLAYSPMFHARLFVDDPKYRGRMFEPLKASLPATPHSPSKTIPSTDLRLDGNPKFDRPLFVQFCANDPEVLLAAARHVQPYCDAVDLNLGCPQGIAKKGHYGAFLQEDWDTIYKLINTLKNGLSIPVTAKFRILETKERTLEYAKMILSAGASILTVHGRRREQKGHNTGVADWSYIRYLRENLPPDTVLFANGNILQHGDIETCLKATGVDGIMSAEGNLSDPSIFAPPPMDSSSREYWTGRDGRGGYRMDAVFRRYLDILYEHVLERPPPVRDPLFITSDVEDLESAAQSLSAETTVKANGKRILEDDEGQETTNGSPKKKRRKEATKTSKEHRTTSPNLTAMKAHLFHFLRPLVSKHTHVRDALARSHGSDMEAYEDVLRKLEAVVKKGMIDYERGVDDGIVRKESKTATIPPKDNEVTLNGPEDAAARCQRPWWVCQPYLRPLPHEAIEKGALTLSEKDKAKLAEDPAPGQLLDSSVNGSTRLEAVNGDLKDKVELPTSGLTCG